MGKKEKLGLIIFLRKKDINALFRGLWGLEGALAEQKDEPSTETIETLSIFLRFLLEIAKGYDVTIKGEL